MLKCVFDHAAARVVDIPASRTTPLPLVYTDEGEFANEMNADDWYRWCAAQLRRDRHSDQIAGLVGYGMAMLDVAGTDPEAPGLEDSVLRTPPLANMPTPELS